MPIGMILFGEPLPTVPPCALVLYTDPLGTVPPSCIAAHLATSWRGPDHAHQARKLDHCGESIRCRAGMANRSGTHALPTLTLYQLHKQHSTRTAHTLAPTRPAGAGRERARKRARSEEHTPEVQSLMRISYAVFRLKKKKTNHRKS